ncbi:MAG: NnrS family protein [Candidatus Binatia bacterium]|nr:NnrS family protein [Candidatus Binatia bacterium]
MQGAQEHERQATVREAGGRGALTPEVEELMRITARRAAWFFVWSIVFALSIGATLGALLWLGLTLQVDLLGGLSPLSARHAHAYAQIFGFAVLFVCGVAYHVLPRFSGRAWQGGPWQRLTLLGLASGAGLAAGAALWGEERALLFLAHAALVFGSLAFARAVGGQLRGAAVTPPLLPVYVQLGSWWLVAASALPLLSPTVLASDRSALWEAALWGFAGNWIYGMSLRILPASLGLVYRESGVDRLICAAHQVGTLLWCLGLVGMSGWLPVAVTTAGRAGGLLLAVAGAGFVCRLGFFRGRATPAHRMPGTEKYLWSAYAYLFLALLLGPLRAAVTGTAYVGPVADFARHAFTLGFLTQMIFGVSMRVLPAAAGIPIWSPRLRDGTYWLLNLGIVLRAGEVITAWGASTAWYRWSAISGPISWAAFVLFAVNLVMSVRQHRPGPATSR